MKNLFCVKDKVIVITGATGVLGTPMVLHFAEQGAKVANIARRKEAGEELEKRVKKAGGEACFLQADVLDKDALENC